MKLNNIEVQYGDRILAIIPAAPKDISMEVYFIGEEKKANGALVAIPKPNVISFNDVHGYYDYGYDLPPEHIVRKDFPSTFYSFWAITLEGITDILYSDSIYTLENIIDQLESEIETK